MSAPSVSGIRQVWHGSVAGHLTPERLAQLLEAAAQGDAHDDLTLAAEMEERDLHYASVLGTRKLAIVGLDVLIESASDDPADAALRDALLGAFADLPTDQLAEVMAMGFAAAELAGRWDAAGDSARG